MFEPKPRMLLAHSVLIKAARPEATKPAKLAPKPAIVVVRKPVLSDRELVVFLGDAVVRGWLSGSAAHDAQRAVEAGGKMAPQVRAILLAAYVGKTSK